MSDKIRSESQFMWKMIKFILKFPFLLIGGLFKAEYRQQLGEPLKDLLSFIFETKLTLFLIVVNVLVFLYQIFLWGTENVSNYIMTQAQLNIPAFLASWFMHASIGHLVGNMLALFIFGRIIEREFGKGQYLMIYFGSALIGTVLSFLFGQIGIGASGAIAGLISASILINPFYVTYSLIIPLPIIVVGWLAIWADVEGILIPQMGDNVGHFAHLGGYLAIALTLFIIEKEKKSKLIKGLIINIALVAIFFALQYFNLINF